MVIETLATNPETMLHKKPPYEHIFYAHPKMTKKTLKEEGVEWAKYRLGDDQYDWIHIDDLDTNEDGIPYMSISTTFRSFRSTTIFFKKNPTQ